MRLNIIFWATVYFSIIVISGCSKQDTISTFSSPTQVLTITAPAESDILDGSKWKLISILKSGELTNVPAEEQPTIVFKNKEMVVQGKCNSFSGRYEIDNELITITAVVLGGIDCPDLKSSMELENRLFFLMAQFKTYVITDHQLKMQYAEGEMILESVAHR